MILMLLTGPSRNFSTDAVEYIFAASIGRWPAMSEGGLYTRTTKSRRGGGDEGRSAYDSIRVITDLLVNC